MRSAPLGEDVADRAAHADEPAASPERIRDLEEARLLDCHRGQRDHVAVRVEVDRLDVLVDDLDIEVGGVNAARMARPSGGITAVKPPICLMYPKLQNDTGKRG